MCGFSKDLFHGPVAIFSDSKVLKKMDCLDNPVVSENECQANQVKQSHQHELESGKGRTCGFT